MRIVILGFNFYRLYSTSTSQEKLPLPSYSTNSSVGDVPQPQPVKIYKNTDLDKLRILQENKGKSGIYRPLPRLAEQRRG